MLDERVLACGLDAVCRARETNYFLDGHRGGAIISAYYYCREVELEEGVAGAIGEIIDENWTHTPLCRPFPDEPPDPGVVEKIADHMSGSMDRLRQAGHNVILPSLALKAFRQLPAVLTPSRVEGLCALIDAFTASENIAWDESNPFPDFGDPQAASEFVLGELLAAIEGFEGWGQGWSGHLLTYGRALLDLRECGHTELAKQAEYAFKLYLARIRMGPQETDKPRPEHPPSDLLPHQTAYWEDRRTRSVEIGHLFKYPYGFYGLMRHAQDSDLKDRCTAQGYHIF